MIPPFLNVSCCYINVFGCYRRCHALTTVLSKQRFQSICDHKLCNGTKSSDFAPLHSYIYLYIDVILYHNSTTQNVVKLFIKYHFQNANVEILLLPKKKDSNKLSNMFVILSTRVYHVGANVYHSAV